MDSDRKYRQHGYSDSSYSNGQRSGLNGSNGSHGSGNGDKPRPSGPRPSIDITGPRLPRLVQAVTASRCYSCSTTLPPGTVFNGPCPKCGAQLHCCKQCVHFEPSTRYQCQKPVPARIALKDHENECGLFSARVTVAREVTSTPSNGNGYGNGGSRMPVPTMTSAPPRNASDARDAFDRLFKK